MHTAATTSRLTVALFSDLVSSTELKSKLGTVTYARLLERHDQLFKQLIAQYPKAEIQADTGDGFFVAFESISDAVRFAIRFQQAMRDEKWEPRAITTRIGIHVGEVAHVGPGEGTRPKLIGMAADIAARVMSLAQGGQILMTRTAFNDARQFIGEKFGDGNGQAATSLRWVAHGDYSFKGHEHEPIEVYEVGAAGVAPLSPPPNNDKAWRSVTLEEEETLGWRPAIGLEVPAGPGWMLQRKIGQGHFGEVWLAQHESTKALRVFKFCFDVDRLRSFKRELTLIRLLRDSLGERKDITKLHHVQLKEPPYYLETEFASGGNLMDWAESQGGLGQIRLDARIEIVANIAEAVAAAHSVGVLHKDIKPSNILMNVERDGSVTPRLSDFGIGLLSDPSVLRQRNITQDGFDQITRDSLTMGGTPMYAPPELLSAKPKPFTMQGDIYALGIVLYQVAVADFGRPLAAGWEREIGDELLREDIAACVEGNPDLRLHSAADLVRRLRTRPQRRAEREAARQAAARHAWRVRMAVLSGVVMVACVFVAIVAVIGYYNARAAADAKSTSEGEARVSERRARLAELDSLATRGDREIDARLFGDAVETYEQVWTVADGLDVSPLRAIAGLLSARAAGPAAVVNRRPSPNPDDKPSRMVCVRVSPSGKYVVATDVARQVHVFELPLARRVATFTLPGWGYGVGFAHRGEVCLIGSEKGEVRSFDVGKWDSPREISKGSAWVYSLAVAPDGDSFVTVENSDPPRGRRGGKLYFWTVSPLAVTKSVPAPKGLLSAAYSPDGERVATGAEEGDITIWNVENATEEKTLSGHTGHVAGVAFTPDGKTLVSGSYDKTVRVWDVDSGKELHCLTGHDGAVRDVSVSADGRRAASASSDESLKSWDLVAGHELHTFSRHAGAATSVDFFADRSGLVSGGQNGRFAVWNTAPDEVPSWAVHAKPVTGLCILPDDLTALSAAANEIRQLDLATGMVLRTLATTRPTTAIATTHDGRAALVASAGGVLELLELEKFTLTPVAMPAPGEAPLLVPATTRAAATPATKRPAASQQAATNDSIAMLSIARHAPIALVGRADGVVSITTFSPASGGVVRRVDGKITAGCLSGDGTRAFVAAERALYVIDTATGRCEGQFEALAPVTAIAMTRDGGVAVSCGYENPVRPWGLPDGGPLRAIAGHKGRVRAVTFMPDDRTVVSGGEDDTVRLWDLDTKNPIHTFTGHAKPVCALAVSRDGTIILSGDETGTIRKWDLSRPAWHRRMEKAVEAACALLDANPNDGGALKTLGEWYAQRGREAWAIDCLTSARLAGAQVSPELMARCYWRLGQRAQAAAEFQKAMAVKDAPVAYFKLCQSAAKP